MTKYLCLSCNKPAKPTANHDPNSAIVYYFAECCLDNTYAQQESIYPQPVQMELP